MHHAHGSDVVEVAWSGRIDAFVPLGQYDKHTVALLNVINEPNRAFASNRQRDHRIRKNDRITDRQNWQLCGNGLDLLLDVVKLFQVAFHGSIRNLL